MLSQMHQLFVDAAYKAYRVDMRAALFTAKRGKYARTQKQFGKGRFISHPAVIIG